MKLLQGIYISGLLCILQFCYFCFTRFESRTSLTSSSVVVVTGDNQSPRAPFNPFSDVQFGPAQVFDDSARKSYPSSHHCVGTGSQTDKNYHSDKASYKLRRPNFISRSCRYKNLYYRPSDQTFHYFPSEKAHNADEERLPGEEIPMQISLNTVDEGIPNQRLEKLGLLETWIPIVHTKASSAIINATFAVTGHTNHQLVFELFRPFHGFNFGHLLWDDFNSLFSLLKVFGIDNYESIQMVPFFVELQGGDPLWRCSPSNWAKWKNCVPMYRKLYPTLMGIQTDCSGDILRTGSWLRGNDTIGVWTGHLQENCSAIYNEPPADYVLLSDTLAGTGRLAKFSCQGDCSIGKGRHYWELQHFFFFHLFGGTGARQLQESPPKGYITFSMSVGSSRPDKVYMFNEEILLAQAKYGNDTVRVVNMASMTIAEQASLAHNSAIFLTNHGGGSAVTIFLQQGAAAFIFSQDGLGKFDHSFYESTDYFRTIWVTVDERQHINRTMALIDLEVEKVKLEWPNIVAGN